jgi:hypothetical protein
MKSYYCWKRKFCSLQCFGNWRKGKTIEEMYGNDKAKTIKEKISEKSSLASTPSFRRGKTYEELYGKERAQELKKKQSEFRKGIHFSEEHKQKISNSNRGKIRSKETRKRISDAVQHQLELTGKSGKIVFPTSYERKIIGLCKDKNLPFKYVGNGKLWIERMNPDFIETNGRKMLIETYCIFWHSKDYEKKRGKLFSKYGFKTLFLNDKDLTVKNWKEICLEKIQNFLSS